MTNLDDAAIGIYLSAKEVSAPVKDALREVVRRKTELGNLQHRKQQLEQEIAVIDQEQERIRNNMQSIDRNTDLYNRYVKKFTDQEDQVENYREEIRGLEGQITEKQRVTRRVLVEPRAIVIKTMKISRKKAAKAQSRIE